MGNVVLTIPGKPKPKSRPKAFRRGDRIAIYTPTSEEENAAAMFMLAHTGSLVDEPEIVVRFIFYGADKRADIDNLIKLYMDALVKADVFGDDRKVAALWAERRSLQHGEQPRTEIIVGAWEGW